MVMTKMPERACDHLFLLVGSNPLPNYLATLVLKPRSVHLLYTPETETVKNRLQSAFEKRLAGVQIKETCIDRGTDVQKVRITCQSLLKDTHLHYTGGIKIMAAHARLVFQDGGGQHNQASYLDERSGVLRFDDGYEIDLTKRNLHLTIDGILDLHGVIRVKKEGNSQAVPTNHDSQKIALKVLDAPAVAEELYRVHRDGNGKRLSVSAAKQVPIFPRDKLHLDLSISSIPEENWAKRIFEEWCDFLGGGWLEVWTGTLLQKFHPENESDVAVGVNCKRENGREFEIDLATVRGHRLFVISCTTDVTIGICKSKLFEVAMRARQLGGDLARSALVCLLHGTDSKGAFVDQLRNDVADIWDAPNTPQIFGLDDLKEWAGIGGKPNTNSLKKWLES